MYHLNADLQPVSECCCTRARESIRTSVLGHCHAARHGGYNEVGVCSYVKYISAHAQTIRTRAVCLPKEW